MDDNQFIKYFKTLNVCLKDEKVKKFVEGDEIT